MTVVDKAAEGWSLRRIAVSILVLVDDGRRRHYAPKLYQGLEFRVNLIGSNRASGPRIGLDLAVQASCARNFGSSESLFS